ncbi:protein maelstrom homolog isoform X2 [Anoplophora glabripennis]|uniref:protein maelstrom homolog isoform X2 n=1 Tax=Anoplophora glabripennis TaxID=217634 RepID=UPI0008754B13|nr:protein maelstrom homolog isoform X2 [Anoplophora glabripennis]
MPPKKQKQTPRNGFFYFMLEFKERQGRNYRSMREVADAAGPHWSKMSKEQRKPYDERALYEKNNLKPGKYTSDGLDIEEVNQMERQAKEKNEEMKNKITEEIKLSAKNGRIQDKMFFLIHINSFCYCASEKRYYPAEIGIAAFNLVDGVLPENVFHSLIKPGLLPLGYASEALSLSNETHQIAPPMADEVDNNVEDVFFTMKLFLQGKMQGSRRMPVLYCHERYMKMVQEILDTWCDDYQEQVFFDVYDLQYMFRVLKNTVAGDNVWNSDTFGNREIEKDVYAYAKGISCEYHDQTNVPIYCSRSIAVRYAYTICDNCCPDLHIPFIPGCHVPHTASVASSRPSSAASGRSSRSSRSRDYTSTIRDDDSESVISVSSKSEWDNQSVSSEVSTINDEDDFPSLGGRGKKNNMSSGGPWRFTPNDSSSVYSQSSTKSYAGATGTAGLSRRPSDMPSSVMDRMDKLSISTPSTNVGQGGVARDFDKGDDFPALGRARTIGARGRGVRRPNW